MARFIYGDRRSKYVEVNLTEIQLIQDTERDIIYKPPQENIGFRLHIPLQAEPFIEVVGQIPEFEFDMLQPIAKIVDSETYVEIDYVNDGCVDTVEWGNITTKQEYEYVSSFIQKCLSNTKYADLQFCKSFEEYVKLRIVDILTYENNVFWNDTAALLAEKMLDRVLAEIIGIDLICPEIIAPDEILGIANEVLQDLLKGGGVNG